MDEVNSGIRRCSRCSVKKKRSRKKTLVVIYGVKGARAKKNMKVKEGNKGYKEENEEQKKA